MFLTMSTGFESRLRAAPDVLVGRNHRGVIGFADRPMAPLFGDDLIARTVETRLPEAVRQIHQTHDVARPPVSTGVSDVHTRDVMVDQGGA